MNIKCVANFLDIVGGQVGRSSRAPAMALIRLFVRRGRVYRVTLAALGAVSLLAGPLDVQARARRLTITIARVRQIDSIDYSKQGELYTRVQIGSRRMPKTGHREDDGDISTKWTFTSAADENSTVRITIGIFDHDSPDKDDHCD